MKRFNPYFPLLFLAMSNGLVYGQIADNNPNNQLPAELKGIEVAERLNTQLQRDLKFTDQHGETVQLGDYFDGKRPVILSLNYYRCPMLCGLTLNAMTDGLKQIDWQLGDEYRLLTVSFEPKETSELARAKRENYLAHYGREYIEDGWDFLVGEQESVDGLLEATGFPIRWNENAAEWIHPACIIVVTPDGTISRYLYGVFYEPKTVRLSLVEASQGKIGTTADQVILWCFNYDADAGGYTLAAFWLMRTAGVLTVLFLAAFITIQRVRERTKPSSCRRQTVENRPETTTTGIY